MHKYASMAKSADAKDLKSFGSDPISVQIRLLAPYKKHPGKGVFDRENLIIKIKNGYTTRASRKKSAGS